MRIIMDNIDERIDELERQLRAAVAAMTPKEKLEVVSFSNEAQRRVREELLNLQREWRAATLEDQLRQIWRTMSEKEKAEVRNFSEAVQAGLREKMRETASF